MRLFVALDLPWILRETLTGICGSLPGARWVAPENLHLTLRFAGETSRRQAEEIDLALQGLRSRRFALALTGTGLFERAGRPTHLWVGVAPSAGLMHLQSKIETALQRARLPAERRRFQPHVSLARVDAVPEPMLAAWIQSHNLLRTPDVTIERFSLFSSQHGPDQPVYIAEVDYELV